MFIAVKECPSSGTKSSIPAQLQGRYPEADAGLSTIVRSLMKAKAKIWLGNRSAAAILETESHSTGMPDSLVSTGESGRRRKPPGHDDEPL